MVGARDLTRLYKRQRWVEGRGDAGGMGNNSNTDKINERESRDNPALSFLVLRPWPKALLKVDEFRHQLFHHLHGRRWRRV